MGSILASGTLALVFDVTPNAYFGTVPVGSNCQSLVLEIVISFLLLFVISGVGTDDRAKRIDEEDNARELPVLRSGKSKKHTL